MDYIILKRSRSWIVGKARPNDQRVFDETGAFRTLAEAKAFIASQVATIPRSVVLTFVPDEPTARFEVIDP